MASRPTLPNLIVAGVQKGGSSWLHGILGRHPDVFMAEAKELRYFNQRGRVQYSDDWDKYLAHFDGASSYWYRGESTPHYYWVKDGQCRYSPYTRGYDTAAEIVRLLGPEVQIIIILRNPVERAISAAHHHFARGRLDADASIWDAPPRLGIVDMGFYRRHLSNWRSSIPSGHLHLLLYEDLVADSRAFAIDVASRLGLGSPRQWLDDPGLYRRVNSRASMLRRHRPGVGSYAGIDRSDRETLGKLFADDISYVRTILGSHVWR